MNTLATLRRFLPHTRTLLAFALLALIFCAPHALGQDAGSNPTPTGTPAPFEVKVGEDGPKIEKLRRELHSDRHDAAGHAFPAVSILIMTTSFMRIIIVLGFLRNALSTQQTPPNIVLIGTSRSF